MKIVLIVLFIFFSRDILSRNIGETEITADEGIEVFQEEKYYLLKKNVKIISDSFNLTADETKIFFDQDLYDIIEISAYVKAKLSSDLYKINASGDHINFIIKSEEINISGLNSKLKTNEIDMFSNGNINVNNINGHFRLEGNESTLNSENIFIKGNNINGKFLTIDNEKQIVFLNVSDENISLIDNNNTKMFANKINYNKETSIIELQHNVKIIRDGETITGDYGTLNMETNSYKVNSNNDKKVKIIISNKDE